MSWLHLNRDDGRTSGRKAALWPRQRLLAIAVLCAVGTIPPALTTFGQASQPTPTSQKAPIGSKAASSYKKLSLDELMGIELMEMEVTSVSKRESTVGQSPSAVH